MTREGFFKESCAVNPTHLLTSSQKKGALRGPPKEKSLTFGSCHLGGGGRGDSGLVSEPTYKFKGARDRQTSQQSKVRNYLIGNILSPSSRIYQGKKYMNVFYETDVRHSREMSKVISGPF